MLEESVEIEKITKNLKWWESQNFAKTSTKINRDILMVYSGLRPFTKPQKKITKELNFESLSNYENWWRNANVFVEGPIIIQTIQQYNFLLQNFHQKVPVEGQAYLQTSILCTLFHCLTMDTVIIQII